MALAPHLNATMTEDKFIWKDEYSVGVQLMDEQHKIFFQMANRVFDCLESKVINHDALINVINDLENYALYHLGMEEEYFNQFHYEEAANHIAVHNQYRETMKKLFNDARQENIDAKQTAQKAALYAGNWLSQHILGMDKGYKRVFNDHGMS